MPRRILQSTIRIMVLRALRVHVAYDDTNIELVRAGKVIVAANHVSLIDGVIIALASPLPLQFGVDTDFSRRSKFAGAGLRLLAALGFGQVVPIDGRSPYGIRALRKALDRGESIMVFPEGAIGAAGRPLPEQPGVTWLADKSGAAIVRVRISGAENSMFFAKAGRAFWPKIVVNF